jgi:hypothetical protein
VAALLASGLVVEASLVMLAPSPDYRYSHWTVVVTIVAAIMSWSRHRARRADGHGVPITPVDMPRVTV